MSLEAPRSTKVVLFKCLLLLKHVRHEAFKCVELILEEQKPKSEQLSVLKSWFGGEQEKPPYLHLRSEKWTLNTTTRQTFKGAVCKM